MEARKQQLTPESVSVDNDGASMENLKKRISEEGE
jgi:hypothetical protein